MPSALITRTIDTETADPDVQELVDVERTRLSAALAARALLVALSRPTSKAELLAVAHRVMLTSGDLWDALGRAHHPQR